MGLCKAIVGGLLSYTPLYEKLRKFKTGGSDEAAYCYQVFGRQLYYAKQAGLKEIPKVVAELGPGDSLGVGLAWLLAGTHKYLAFDVEKYADLNRNRTVLFDLKNLFEAGESYKNECGYPNLKPTLADDVHPQDLAVEVDASIDGSILDNEKRLKYVVPWQGLENVEQESVDLIFSQAVMEHVDDPKLVYQTCFSWLKPGGLMLHQIDFKAHGTSKTWDGYRSYSTRLWTLIRGKRPYLINRWPASWHVRAMQEAGFKIVNDQPAHLEPTAKKYAGINAGMNENDQNISGLFVIAQKPS